MPSMRARDGVGEREGEARKNMKAEQTHFLEPLQLKLIGVKKSCEFHNFELLHFYQTSKLSQTQLTRSRGTIFRKICDTSFSATRCVGGTSQTAFFIFVFLNAERKNICYKRQIKDLELDLNLHF